MGKIAFVFSGQGDQFPGMGKDLYDNYAEAREVFDMCDRIRPNTSAQCFAGTREELRDTANTQPALFAVELAGAKVLKSHGIFPDAVAGFSLGEVAACTFAGAFSLDEGFRLVAKRGELMKESAGEDVSFMAAVLKLEGEQVKEICRDVKGVYAVNFNCPGQTTVSGHKAQKELFKKKTEEAGGRMVVLNVSGAFHSPFMENAAERFREELEPISFHEPVIDVYSNVTALPYREKPKDLLASQIMSPVRWEDTIRNMICSGIETFIEVGPGNTLSGLIRRIDKKVKTYSISDLPKVFEEVQVC